MPASPLATAVAAVPAGPGAVVRASGVVKRYGHTAVLDGVNFDVPHGITGLLGANGAGKTTLLGLLLGLHAPQSGRLEVLGMDPASLGPRIRSRVGYVPEHHTLPPDLRADEFVQHVAEVHGLPRGEATARASDSLWWVGLGDERVRPLGSMSVGQRQRVKLAMAIAPDPDVVFLDEPTDGLDPTQRDSMLELVRRIGTEFGISVLLSSHLLDEVERTCDHVVILEGGRVAAAGPMGELRGQGRGVAVELAGRARDIAVVADRLRRLGYGVTLDGSRFTVQLPPVPLYPAETQEEARRELLRAVRDEVAAGNVGIRRLQQQVVSLEDVFLGVSS